MTETINPQLPQMAGLQHSLQCRPRTAQYMLT